MKLLELRIQGFKSFDNQEVISFENNAPGLYLLTGENQVEPKLGANGAGKSTVLDAIVWALFDNTSRKLKAKNIKNWRGKNKVVVSLLFISRHNRKIELTRTWQPNSLKWSVDGAELATVTQDELEAEIGLSYDMFLATIMVPQFSTMFFDEKPLAQAQLFSEILQLDEWLEYSDEAKRQNTDRKALLSDVEQELATVRGKLAAWQELDFEKDIADWEVERKARIKAATSRMPLAKAEAKVLKKNIATLEIDLKNYNKELAAIEGELREVDTDLKEINADIAKANKVVRSFEDALLELRTQEKPLKRAYTKMETLEGECTNCGQTIDEAHREKELEAINDQLNDLSDKMDAVNADKDKAIENTNSFNGELSECEDERAELLKEIRDCERKISQVTQKINSLNADLKRADQDVRRAQSQKSDIASEENPFSKKQKLNEDNISASKSLLLTLDKDDKRLRRQVAQYTYWVKSFKEVRLFLISEALTQLEVEVNSNLGKLGMQGWSITFDVESAKADGTLKKGFNILIKSPNNDEAVPWQAWSGGESQRLRIAGITGLTNMILNRKGITANCEFWDEPTNGINASGVTDLLATLRDHARESNRQVWLVDHRSLNEGDFRKILTVVKDSDGSWIDDEDA